MNSRQTQGLTLMITFIGLLVVPGLAYNNLQANGLVNNSQTMTCTGNTCVLSAPSGCQLNSAYCSLNNNFQFLNTCSPFTGILTLNFIGFVNSFFSNCGQSSSQTTPLNQPINSSAFTLPGPYVFTQCVVNVAGLTNPGISIANILCQAVTPSIVSTQYSITVSAAVPLYFSFGGPATLITAGCPQSTWNGVIGNTTAGSTPTATYTCMLGFITSGSNVVGDVAFSATCLTYGDYNGYPGAPGNLITSVSCSNVRGLHADTYSNGGTQIASTITASQGLISFLLTLLGAGIFLILGLGIGGSLQGSILGTGTGASVTTNPQGSKFAQTFGIGMVIWFPLYSEFSTWFTSGVFPIGLDGSVGIISAILIAGFFFGLYSLSQSGTSAGQ